MARKKKSVEEISTLAEEEVVDTSSEIIEVQEDEVVLQEQPKLSLEDRYKQLGLCPRQASVYLYKEYPFAEVNSFLSKKLKDAPKAKLKGCCK